MINPAPIIDEMRTAAAAPFDEDAAFTAARLVRAVAPASPDTPGQEVVERFVADPGLHAVAVVDHGRVVGLVDRAGLLTTFARPLMSDLYGRRPIRLLMDAEPLVVDAALTLGEVGQRIAGEKPEALACGFVITEGGRYRGVASAMDLMASSVEQADVRARQVEEARAAAEAANRAKTAFLANMSHEIRTPLNAIMGFAEILQQEMVGPLGSDIYREYAGDIVESGRHLMQLIDDLLDLSKAEADKLDLHEAPVDAGRIAHGCIRLLSERAARARVHLALDIPRDLPPLWADERKLRQMVLNLLSNAVKFTPVGGTVTLTGGLAADGALRVAVADTGVGMTPAELAQAMEPWGQVHSALNRRHVGTGLGLPLTRRLVELHGGALETDSEPGRGTVMTLVFPAERVQARADADRA
ncbi:ATP-binding protein [Azospirillum halopraeferens]|uniref:ATP-binding protein n=1 Tax=Azospirillum halopraeferens TaxID=34010 RepID=UPI0003FB26AF|nr:ATP-binding protein [Azospirillum halopraeferens]